eukprot:758407-Hanusia_phi.AAC.4
MEGRQGDGSNETAVLIVGRQKEEGMTMLESQVDHIVTHFPARGMYSFNSPPPQIPMPVACVIDGGLKADEKFQGIQWCELISRESISTIVPTATRGRLCPMAMGQVTMVAARSFHAVLVEPHVVQSSATGPPSEPAGCAASGETLLPCLPWVSLCNEFCLSDV